MINGNIYKILLNNIFIYLFNKKRITKYKFNYNHPFLFKLWIKLSIFLHWSFKEFLIDDLNKAVAS